MKILILFILLTLLLCPDIVSQWSLQSSPTTSDLYDITFTDSQLGWIVGDSIILLTNDSGFTWQSTGNKDYSFSDCFFTNSRNGWAVGVDHSPTNNPLIAHTINGGHTWNFQIDSVNTSWDAVWFVDTLHGWIAGGFDSPDTRGIISKTTDGGNVWATYQTNLKYIRDVYFLDTVNGWACGQFGAVYKTEDGGDTWDSVYQASNPLRKIFFSTNDSGWAVGGISGDELIIRTTDGGISWNETTTSGSSLQGLWFINSQNGWAVGGRNIGPRILHTSDGGETWNVQQHDLIGNSITLNSIYMMDNNLGWIVGTNGTILKTMNGGITDIVDRKNEVPVSFNLFQNYPNPFNPVTNISFQIPTYSFVKLRLYDILGNEISSLVEERKSPGVYTVQFNSIKLSGGIYFYRLDSEQFSETKSFIIIK